MTNQEGWAIIFLCIFIGLPLLCLILILGYAAHRKNAKAANQDGITPPEDNYPVSTAAAVREFFFSPDLFYQRTGRNKTDLWRPFAYMTFAGVIFVITMFYYSIWPVFIPLVLFPLYFCWVIISVALFGITIPFKGEGSLIATLQNTGYAIVFGLTLAELSYIIQLLYFGLFAKAAYTADLMTFSKVSSIIIVILTAIPMTYGLKQARMIPLFRAALSVSVVLIVAIFLAYGWPLLIR